MKQLKVLHVGPRNEVPGGITEFCKGIICYDSKDVNFKYLGTCVSGNKNKIIKNIQFLNSTILFLVYLFMFKPEIVHIHSSSDSSFYRKSIFVILSKLCKRKILFHIHSGRFIDFYNSSNKYKRNFIKRILESSNVVLALTELWKEKLLKEFNCNIKVLPNYIDLLQFDGKDTSIKKNKIKQIVFMGKVSESKGIYDVIEVIKITKLKKIKCKFKIAGNGTPNDLKKFNDAIIKNRLEDYIEYVGWVSSEDKIKLLSSSDIFILPSHFEAFGIVFLEAMYFGLPIISTNVGGIPEVVINNQNGFLVSSKSPEDLFNSLMTLLENKQLYNNMSKNNMLRAKKFDRNKIIKLLIGYYLDMRVGNFNE
ncbi:glycosyltransferase family 4 protein [Gottfriedia acidiceleris]|uniref:glycosyltransferase family 4 protein n=1 Tax=Gottfriedia acidiceleris TaxID=371036 RepID=UPI003000C8BD